MCGIRTLLFVVSDVVVRREEYLLLCLAISSLRILLPSTDNPDEPISFSNDFLSP
jgi:hypothetical protein